MTAGKCTVKRVCPGRESTSMWPPCSPAPPPSTPTTAPCNPACKPFSPPMNAWLDVVMVPQVRPFSGEATARVGSSKPSPYMGPAEAASIIARVPQGALPNRPNRYVQSLHRDTFATSSLTLDFQVESIDTRPHWSTWMAASRYSPGIEGRGRLQPVVGAAPGWVDLNWGAMHETKALFISRRSCCWLTSPVRYRQRPPSRRICLGKVWRSC